MEKITRREVGLMLVFCVILVLISFYHQNKYNTRPVEQGVQQGAQENSEQETQEEQSLRSRLVLPATMTGELVLGFYSDKIDVSGDITRMHNSGMPVPTVIGTFRSPAEAKGVTENNLNEINATGAIPFINVMVNDTAESIANGLHDNALIAQCAEMQSAMDGRPIIVTPLPESNGNWTPYGTDPVNFKKSFSRIQSLCSDLNALWAWAPNQSNGLSQYEPENYDLIAPSLFGFSEQVSVDDAVMSHIELVAEFTDKPILIGQTGTCAQGEDKSVWVQQLIEKTTAHPRVLGFLYFNYFKPHAGECNWKVWDGGTLNTGWLNTLRTTDIVSPQNLME